MSAARRRAASTPDMGGLTDDWGKLAAIRKGEHGQEETKEPKKSPRTAEPESAVTAGTSMSRRSRRSWYADAQAAEELARVVDDIHHATRVPKHEVVSELFRAAVAAAPRVQKKLTPKE